MANQLQHCRCRWDLARAPACAWSISRENDKVGFAPAVANGIRHHRSPAAILQPQTDGEGKGLHKSFSIEYRIFIRIIKRAILN